MGNLFIFFITSILVFARNIIPAPVEPEPAKFSGITRAKLGDSFCLRKIFVEAPGGMIENVTRWHHLLFRWSRNCRLAPICQRLWRKHSRSCGVSCWDRGVLMGMRHADVNRGTQTWIDKSCRNEMIWFACVFHIQYRSFLLILATRFSRIAMNFLLDPMWGGLYVRNGVAGKGQGATVAGRLLGKASLESISFWDPFLSCWEGWGFSSFLYCGHPKILHNFTHPYLFNSPTLNFLFDDLATCCRFDSRRGDRPAVGVPWWGTACSTGLADDSLGVAGRRWQRRKTVANGIGESEVAAPWAAKTLFL